MTRRRPAARPVRPLRRGGAWTIQRATGAGVVAALAAVLLRLVYPSAPELVRLPLIGLCLAAAFCGLSILWITAVDRFRHGRRGERLVPLRTFDVALALLLTLPALFLVPALIAET